MNLYRISMHLKLKRKLTIIAGIGLVMFLSGCTNNNNNNTASGPITLQWRGVFWDPKIVQPLLDEYHQLNPNVTVSYADRWPTSGTSEQAANSYKADLDRILQGGNAAEIPDLYMVENTWSGTYANKYAAPAPSSVIDATAVKANFYPAVVEDFARNDKVTGLPLWLDTLAIVYNKNLLAAQSLSAPPADTTNFKNKAIQLTTRSAGVITSAGFAAGVSANVGFGPEYLNLLFLQNGVPMIDANGNPIFADSDNASSALSYLKSFSGGSGSWDSSQKFDAIAFLEGKLAMMVTTSWRLQQMLSFNDLYALNLNIGVAPMPQIPQQPVVNWATYWGVMVSNNRPNSTEAWKFLAWLTQPEQLRKLRQNEVANSKYSGILYPRTDMQQEADITGDTKLQVFNAELSTAQSWYMVDGLDVRSAFNDLIDTAGTQANISQTQTTIRDIISKQ